MSQTYRRRPEKCGADLSATGRSPRLLPRAGDGILGSMIRVLPALAVVAVLLASCGSSKPAYCGNVSNLKNSVHELRNVNVSENGVSALTSQLKTIESNAKSVVSSAQTDFPNETAALSSSLSQLKTALTQLPSAPSATDLAGVARLAKSSATAVTNLASATSSKCG